MLIISILLIFFAGASEAIMDKLQFHFDKSIFSNKDKYKQLFWNPIDSWKNKWKEDLKTERFAGSSTMFVFTTDAWHLFKLFRNLSIFIGIFFIAITPSSIIMTLIYILIIRIVFGLSFTLFYKILSNKRIKKNN